MGNVIDLMGKIQAKEAGAAVMAETEAVDERAIPLAVAFHNIAGEIAMANGMIPSYTPFEEMPPEMQCLQFEVFNQMLEMGLIDVPDDDTLTVTYERSIVSDTGEASFEQPDA